jgi:hypothetical protein
VVQRAPAGQTIGPVQRIPAAQIGARPGVLIGIDRARN